jgi:hypothetical protein
MTPIAHLSGIPIKELTLPLAYGGDALLLMASMGIRAHGIADRKPTERSRA